MLEKLPQPDHALVAAHEGPEDGRVPVRRGLDVDAALRAGHKGLEAAAHLVQSGLVFHGHPHKPDGAGLIEHGNGGDEYEAVHPPDRAAYHALVEKHVGEHGISGKIGLRLSHRPVGVHATLPGKRTVHVENFPVAVKQRQGDPECVSHRADIGGNWLVPNRRYQLFLHACPSQVRPTVPNFDHSTCFIKSYFPKNIKNVIAVKGGLGIV